MKLRTVSSRFKWLAVLSGLFLCLTAQAAESRVSGGRYGDVAVEWPTGEIRGFVVLFSGGKGWTDADTQAARALAREGALTVGVDTQRYSANLAATGQACRHLDGDAEAVSHQLERQLKSDRYFAPIMAGTGQGATLALHVLAQAPANTIAGAVAVDAQGKLDRAFRHGHATVLALGQMRMAEPSSIVALRIVHAMVVEPPAAFRAKQRRARRHFGAIENRAHRRVYGPIRALGAFESAKEQALERLAPTTERRWLRVY